VEWSYGTNGNTAYHRFALQTQAAYSEVADQGEWGNWYYATSGADGMTHRSGADGDVRSQFITTGALDNSNDDNHRAINDRYPVFAFSNNLGRVGNSQANSLFTIFHAQRDGAQLNTGSGLESVPSYWSGQYGTDEDALAFFHGDYNNIYDKSVQLDGKITNDAVAVGGQDYLTVVSLGAREALGATSVAGTQQNPYIFMKEISSNGNMNTADVIFPASPIFLYLNPTWLKYLLDPLYIIQENGLYPQDFALHDIGAHYPNGTGHGDGIAQEQPVEESGNMLIMTLAYAQKTGDTAYLSAHYKYLRQWADYLVKNCLIPANQQSTDDFAGLLANQTNLALKGIIGIQAMSEIAKLTGQTSNYSSIASDYISKWQDLAIARNATPPHTTLSYGDTASHGLLYNLYADALLQTNLVPRSVYEMQSAFYPTVSDTFGTPLDTRHDWVKSDWEMFAAAVAGDDTRNEMVSRLARWVGDTPTNSPATDLYQAQTGGYAEGLPHFAARPVVGGWYALLILGQVGIQG
jgi:hypothetical protein